MKIKLLLILLFSILKAGFAQINYSFSTQNTVYNLLTGAIVPVIIPAFSPTKTALDEGFVNNIPLGFTFQYNGENYSSIHLNTNGFASLGAPFLAANFNPNYHLNELRNAVEYKGAIRPIIAPLWDDLILSSVTDLSYKTEGLAPNRIFTAQWQHVIWQGGSPAISFQLKLHETTNIVSFHYQDESGSIGANASASIGITSSKTEMPDSEINSPYFLSLNTSQNTAMISSDFETENIASKPVTGQEFRFAPKPCMTPNFIKLMDVNTNSATISWVIEQATSNYQIAISNIDVKPVLGNLVNANNHTFNNLTPNTQYFFFIKNDCGVDWARLKFTTTSLVTLPYTETFETTLDVSMPANMTQQNLGYNFAEMNWQTTDLLASINGASGNKKALISSRFANANSWLYTPSFSLVAGAIYNLIFKYSSTAPTNLGAKIGAVTAIGLQVKYGLSTGEASMINSITNLTNISNTNYITENLSFTPSLSGDYNIGFNYTAGVSDAIFLLDDISLSQVSAPLPLNLISFDAILNNENIVELSWITSAENNLSHFELERSEEGKSFQYFGKTTAQNKTNFEKNKYEYYDRKPQIGSNFYRLKMVDFDGKFTYSPIKFISLKDNFATILYPNPSGKTVFLKVPNASITQIKVYNLEGKSIPINSELINNNELKINLLHIITGLYLVNIITATETRILKWVVR